MAVGSISNSLYPVQGYFSQTGSLLKYMNSLTAQSNATSKSSSYFNSTLYSDLGNVSVKANALKSEIFSMASLSQYSQSIGKEASYTNDEILSASVAKNATVSTYTKTDVNVRQLASSQENKGDELKASENSFGDKFDLSITNSAGKTSAFSVSLADKDDNKIALAAMAKQINASDIGVKATVVENQESGTVSLQLSGMKTGEKDGKFTVKDESAANIGVVSKASQNAEYTVNGAAYSSQSNESVKLMDGVTATLKKTGSTQLTYASDAGSAAQSVQGFINAFNELKNASSSFPDLDNQIMTIARNFSRALGFSGITMDSKGMLSISDESKLSQSIADGSFAKNFQGVGSLGNKLRDVSGNAFKMAYNSALQETFVNFLNSNYSNSQLSNSWMNNNWLNNTWQSGSWSNNSWLNSAYASSGMIVNILV